MMIRKKQSVLLTFACLFCIYIPSSSVERGEDTKIGFPIYIVHEHDVTSFSPVVTSGIVDRIYDDHQAVILLENLDEQVVVSVDQLPPGSKENTWLVMKLFGSFIRIIAIDEERTIKEKITSEQIRKKLINP